MSLPARPQPALVIVAHPATNGADSAQIADTAVSTWRGIEAVLSPIVGARGFAALYARSLHLARADHAWLPDAEDAALAAGEFVALRAALSEQPSESASAASDALLKTFHGLLKGLIGAPLTERLLNPWCTPLPDAPTGQETPP